MARPLTVTLLLTVALCAGLIYWYVRQEEPTPPPNPRPQAAHVQTQIKEAPVWGRVVDARGAMVPGATVRCDDVAVLTNMEGAFRCPKMDAGSHSLIAHHDQYCDLRPTGAGRVKIVVHASRANGPWVLTLRKAATAEGHVVRDHRPVARAALHIHYLRARGLRDDTSGFRLPSVTHTDEHGRFRIAGLPPGRLWLEASTTDGASGRTPIFDLQDGERRTGLLLKTLASGGLTVRVLGPAGDGMAAHVSVMRPGATAPLQQQSSPAGFARWPSLPSGAWSVRASARGYQQEQARTVKLSPHGQITQIIRMTALRGLLGKVMSAQHTPVTGAEVEITCSNGTHSSFTDTKGNFHWPDGQAPCEALAHHARHGRTKTTPIHPTEPLTLRLGQAGRLRGLVVTAAGRPAPNALVKIQDVTRLGVRQAMFFPPAHAQPDGTWDLGQLAPGTYSVSASAPGHPPSRVARIEVQAADDKVIEMKLDAGARVQGRVVGADGLPATGAEVLLWPRGAAAGRRTTTDDEGRYVLRGVPGGRYTFRAVQAGALPDVSYDLLVPSEGELQHDFHLPQQLPQTPLTRAGGALAMKHDGLYFESVTPGGRLALAGVRAGDRLASVEFQRVEEASPAELARAIENGSIQVTVEVIGPAGETRTVYVDVHDP